MRLKNYIKENITYSKIMSNKQILKDRSLSDKLKKLDHKFLKGGFGAVLNYPDENPSVAVIAYDDKEPIGWISLTDDKYQNIFVHPKYRKTADRVASTLKDILYKRIKVK